MDESESLVEQYLRSFGYEDVVHEPNGNVPPDFVVDKRIAIEVRRLNQNIDDGTGKGRRGIEEAEKPLGDWLRNYLSSYGPGDVSDQRWFVCCSFRHPRPEYSNLKEQLDDLLRTFMDNPDRQPLERDLTVGMRFKVSLIKGSTQQQNFFTLGGLGAEEAGGWVLSEIYENLRHCIKEKERKISKHRGKYPEWWLILPDHIGHGLSDLSRNQFHDKFSIETGGFDKIILINPLNAARAFQVHPRPTLPIRYAQSESK
ncbi:MAG: hypothetical protein EAZ99_10960 [Alphaproteobacteria bacterium]|nr:MAG: hypothetical protein EAZ99_10960 [Alphaproteobacteria bacterium]